MSRYVFKLPDLGEGTVEAEIVAWRVKPGDEVSEDDVLVEVMTEKAAVEVPAPVSGKIVATTGQPGDMVAVGAELVVLETASPAGAPRPAPDRRRQRRHQSNSGSAAAPAEKGSRRRVRTVLPPDRSRHCVAVATPDPGRRVLTSPAIRRRAKEAGIDLRQVAGSGPQGRIGPQDFEAFAAAARAACVAAVTSLPTARPRLRRNALRAEPRRSKSSGCDVSSRSG